MSQINLLCIPYAGGAARAIYGKWVQQLDKKINVFPLELAGHGGRMSEPFYPSLDAAVEDLLEHVEPIITKHPYAIYGHSMGTIIAYELAIAIREAQLPEPCTFFLSGRLAPHHKYRNNNIHQWSDADFLEEIIRIGGTPRQLIESKELVDIFLPILRNDYRIIEKHHFKNLYVKFRADIEFFYSNKDYMVTKPNVMEWKDYTTGSFNFYEFEGGHFFINDAWPDICKIINHKLLNDIERDISKREFAEIKSRNQGESAK